MNATERLELLREFYRDKLTTRQRHVAAATLVGHYDFNNTYQYIIAREDTHLSWLQAALRGFGVPLPAAGPGLPPPITPKAGKKTAEAAFSHQILDDDATSLREFVQRWTPRLAGMSNARHRTMLGVIVGESSEHARLFAQAAAGFEDLLGRRTVTSARVGGVLSTRWVE